VGTGLLMRKETAMIENKIENFADPRALINTSQSNEGSFILEVPLKHRMADALDANYLSVIRQGTLKPLDKITVRGGNPSAHWFCELLVIEVARGGKVNTMMLTPPRFIEPHSSFFVSGHEQDDGYLLDRRNKVDSIGTAPDALRMDDPNATREMLRSLNKTGRRPAAQMADMLNQLEEAFERNLLTKRQYEAATFELHPLIDEAGWKEINRLRGRVAGDGGAAKASAA
jgi:hypothetical protein